MTTITPHINYDDARSHHKRNPLSRTAAALLLLLMPGSLISCRSAKSSIQAEPVILTERDEQTIEREVVTTIDTVTIFVEIPAQSAYRETPDSVSHLETDYAVSDAWINRDGSLGHSLENKTRSAPVDVPVPKTMVNNNRTEVKVKEVPVPVPQPFPVEKSLSMWVSFKIEAFWYLAAFSLFCLLFILRKPLVSTIKKISRL